MENLITSPNIIEVQELQVRLENAGIRSEISQNMSPYVTASGSTITYTLLVGPEKLDEAIEIVHDYENKLKQEVDEEVLCPECGSDDVMRTASARRRNSILYLLVGIISLGVFLLLPLYINWLYLTRRLWLLLLIIGVGCLVKYFKGGSEASYECNNCHNRFKREQS